MEVTQETDTMDTPPLMSPIPTRTRTMPALSTATINAELNDELAAESAAEAFRRQQEKKRHRKPPSFSSLPKMETIEEVESDEEMPGLEPAPKRADENGPLHFIESKPATDPSTLIDKPLPDFYEGEDERYKGLTFFDAQFASFMDDLSARLDGMDFTDLVNVTHHLNSIRSRATNAFRVEKLKEVEDKASATYTTLWANGAIPGQHVVWREPEIEGEQQYLHARHDPKNRIAPPSVAKGCKSKIRMDRFVVKDRTKSARRAVSLAEHGSAAPQ